MEKITSNQVVGLMEAYNAVYAPQINEEQVWEGVDEWVNALLEEGYDLSEFTWEEMYEAYITEYGVNPGGQKAIDKVRSDMAAERQSASRLDDARAKRFPGSYRTVSPTPTAKAAPAAAKPAAKPQFGTTTPRGSSVPSTGVSGLSAADRAAYSAGGGNAKAQQGKGMSSAQVIAQGKTNLGRMDQGKPAARPAAPAARPAAPAARPAAPAARPAAPAATPAAKAAPAAAAPSTAAPKKPSLRSGIDDLKKMGDASRQRQGLTQSFDPFDTVLGHLIDEGYADTEQAALQIMANMSEEWKNSIIG